MINLWKRQDCRKKEDIKMNISPSNCGRGIPLLLLMIVAVVDSRKES